VKKRLLVLMVVLLSCGALPAATFAQTKPEFKLGFQVLAGLIPDVVGTPLENEYFNLSNGNSEQHTTKGLMVWRKIDNWTAYTNGYMTWVNGPYGVQNRLNSERFSWEKDTPAPAAPVASPANGTIYQATFDGTSTGWLPLESDSISAGTIDGQYRVLSKTAAATIGYRATQVDVPDFDLAVDIRFANPGAASAALTFNHTASSSSETYYAFQIWREGDYSVYAATRGLPSVSLASGPAPMVSKDGVNRIKVRRQGSAMAFYVNDQLLTTLSDSRFTGKWVGAAVWFTTPGGESRLDNFTVTAIPAGTPPISPPASAQAPGQATTP
jgi:hypothetical protein